MTLENSLLSFQMDKDRLQNEFNKIPESHRLNHNQQQRRVELEQEMIRTGNFLLYYRGF